MKLRKLARQLAAAAVAGAMALSLCMSALAETWDISNKPEGFAEVYSINVTGTADGRTVELFGVDASNESVSASSTESTETVLSGSSAASISLRGYDVPVSVALDGLSIKSEDDSPSAVCIDTGGDASVELRGENTLTNPDKLAIRSGGGSLTLGGNGTLNIRGFSGISTGQNCSFTMNGGSVYMAGAANTGAMESGIAADTITLNDGSIHVLIAPSPSIDSYNDALYARNSIIINDGSVEVETVKNSDPFITTFPYRALHSLEGDIVISGGSVQAEGGELYAGGDILISNGKVIADSLIYKGGLTISGGEVTAKGFNGQDPIVLSGSAKVTCDSDLRDALWRFDLSGLTTDGFLKYRAQDGSYVVIPGTKEPPAPADTDTGNASGDAGGALAAVAIGGAALWGGYEAATRVILHNLLPEGAAIPKTQAQLAVLLWNTAGQPEPVNEPAFADVDAATAKAAQWCTEQGYLNGTFKPDKRVAKYNVIRAWNKAFPKH